MDDKNWTPATMGKKGGAVKSTAKAEAARRNGLRGGRPKTGAWLSKLTREQINHVRFEAGRLSLSACKEALRPECQSCVEIGRALNLTINKEGNMETQEFWKLTDKELKKLFNPPFDRRRLVDVSPRWRAVLFAECDWSRSARKIVGTGRGYLAGIDDNGQRWGWIVNNLVQPLDPRGYSVPSGSIETAIKLAYDLPYWVPLEGAIRQGDLLFVPGEPEPPFWACRSCYRQVPEDRRHEDCPGCGKPGSIVLCGVVRFSPVASGAAILRGSHRIASEDLELDSNYYWVRSPNPITVTHPSHQEVVLPPGTYRIYRSLVNDGD